MSDYARRKQSDVVWTACSKIITTPSDDTHYAVKIPKKTLVLDIAVNKTTAYTDAGALVTLGFVGNNETADTDAFMSSAVFNPAVVGVSSIKQGSVKNSGGKYFDRAGTITVTSDDNGGTAGTFQIFVSYIQLSN